MWQATLYNNLELPDASKIRCYLHKQGDYFLVQWPIAISIITGYQGNNIIPGNCGMFVVSKFSEN